MKRNQDFRNVNPHFRPTHKEGVDIMLIVNEERMNTYSNKKSTQIVLDAWRCLPDYKKDEYRLISSMENKTHDDGLSANDYSGINTVDRHLVVPAPAIGTRNARFSIGREKQIHERKGSFGFSGDSIS